MLKHNNRKIASQLMVAGQVMPVKLATFGGITCLKQRTMGGDGQGVGALQATQNFIVKYVRPLIESNATTSKNVLNPLEHSLPTY